MYTVMIKKRVEKNLEKMPKPIQKVFRDLLLDLEFKGPIQADWPNYDKIGKNEYHCHLAYKWVACWKNDKNSITIEVYYAGSREDAPY